MSVVWSRSGKLIASGYYNNTIKIINAKTCKVIHTLYGHTCSVT